MIEGQRPLRIAVVAPIMVHYDAISLAARDTVRTFSADPRFTVRHFGTACHFSGIPHRHCGGVSDLLLDAEYRAADVAIFHFGIHHGVFDALLAGGPALRIVRFHNVTPVRFVGPKDVPVVERSLRQIEILRRAQEIWADSPSNARDLLERGFDPCRVRVIPLVVEDPSPSKLEDKPHDAVRVLYVGRFAPSKGLHDLVAAVGRLPRGAVRLTLAGNTTWSDPAYLAHVRALIVQFGLQDVVDFAGMVDDTERERLFRAAHILAIPSYHEGFCRPVAEGFHAGCIPLVYDAYNLPHIAAHLGRVVPPGDIGALAAALGDLATSIPAALTSPSEPLLALDRGMTSAAVFTELAHSHVAAYSYETVVAAMQDRVLRLADTAASG